jgi:hypothetical protein
MEMNRQDPFPKPRTGFRSHLTLNDAVDKL